MAGARLPRIDPRPLAWGVAATVLAVGGGLIAGESDRLAIVLAAIGVCVVLLWNLPFEALVAALLVIAAIPLRETVPYALAFAGLPLILLRLRATEGKRVTVPLLLLLAFALPSVPLRPSHDEGLVDPNLHLPIIGTAYAPSTSIELFRWLTLAAVLVVFSLAIWSVRGRRRLDLLLGAIVVSSLYPLGSGIEQWVSGQTYERVGSSLRAVKGTFPHPNYFAFYVVVVLTVAVYLFLETSRLALRVALLVPVGGGLFCLFLTYTRSAWFGFALTIVLMGLFHYRRLLLVGAVGVVLALVVAPGATQEAQQRFGDLTARSEANDQNSWQWRVDQWSAMLPYGSDHPLTGNGWESYSRLTVRKFGHFNERYPTVLDKRRGVYSALGFSAHNDYVKDYVEVGVPGLLLWVLVLLGNVGLAWRARRVPALRGLGSTAAALALAFVVMSAVDNVQSYTAALTYLFALMGALVGVAGAARLRRPAAPLPDEVVAPPPVTATAAVAEPPAPPPDEPEPAEPRAQRPRRGVFPASWSRLRDLLDRRGRSR